MRCGWPIRVFRLNGHSRQFFSQQLIFVSIYKAGIPSRIARSLQIKKCPASGFKPEVELILDTPYMGVIILRSLSALPFHPAGGDVHMSFDQVILLLSLISGSIYATASLTIKILEHLQKKKD